uniref:Microtubule-actin cross-linking factor 1 n=1 Tax=Gadus morhua TaxID=8049 RepID=A0A8C5BJI2_GADMO
MCVQKEVEEEMQARVGPVSDLLGWVKGLQGRSLGPNAESSLAAQQAVTEQLSARKEEVAEAIRSTQVFLQSKQASKLSPEESARVRAQLEELTSTYSQLCDSSSQQLRKMEHQLAKEEEEKKQTVIAGIIDMGSMEIFSVFSAAQCGLIDQETCRFLLEAQLISGGLLQPPSPQSLSLEHALAQGMIDNHTSQSLSYLERALHLVNETKSKEGEKQCLLPVAIALEEGVISEHLGLHILEVHMNTGGLRYPSGELVDLDTALEQGLLPSRIYIKLQSQLQRRELIDPNTAERLSLSELQQRCISHEESGLHLLPVKQQSERTVSLRSGRKVGIFRASQEGLVDQNVTVRLLEAQLFAGGIVDPRSGNRLILDEALSQGLMHQNQACTILARQLQTGGILDPRSGERLGLDESLCRDLLSPSLALLVLESLQSFMGMLWPESGELVPIAEALQQGGVSEDLARNVLGQRHVVGALYDVGALHLVPLSQTSEKALDLSVAKVLSKIHIPDVLPSTPSSPPSTNRISWCSTSSSPSPSSQPPGSLTTGHVWDSTPLDSSETQEQAKHVLLSHLMTHSYVDVHSGKRLVLLDAELVELVKATGLSCADTSPGYQVQEEGSSLIAGSMQTIGSIRTLVYSAEGEKEETAEVVKTSCQAIPKVVLSSKIIERKGRTSQESKNGVGDRALQQTSNQKIEPAIGGKGEKKIENVTAKGEIEIAPRSENFAGKPLSQQVNKSDQHKEVRNKEGSSPSKQADTSPSINQDNATSSVVNTERVYAELEQDLAIVESSKTIDSAGSQAVRSMGYAQIVQKSDLDYKSQFINRSSETNKTEEEAEMERLTIELKQGGLLTEEGDRLLPDEAVAQGILPGQTAVKLMSQAGLFGGFLDATSGELLSLEDVMQEDLLDEDLMWSVLKSDKSLSGVVDIDKGNVCGLREAAQKGLIDSNTASRLLEAQVLSGGIVDLNRDEKVSVTLAANLGLIKEDQKESLEALENAYKGKATEPQTAIAKATIQLQMEGIVDPESRSPVPLECAIQKGLIGSEEAYQALSKQVAEGGILHHASGTRLSVSDALERGLVDRSLAPGLEELQCVYKGNISLLAHPEAALFQASTGAIYSPESERKLTLTEAVSKGLLEEKVAKEAMASDSVTQGVIDPQSCRIVPYSHLVHQGKIDLNTGKRFLEVKQFSGIQDEQTGDILTLKQAIAIGKVDPVPALRLLQSQADSGGIIDITSGDRLPLPEASEKGLIEEDMAREIAINQITKGGLIHPTTGQRVANLDDAIIAGLISSEMAFDIQESMTLAEIDEGEGSSTPMVSSNSAYSPGADSSVASNQVKWSSESSLSTTPLLEQSGIGLVFKEVDQKQLDSLTSNQLSLCDATLEEDTVEQPLSESDSSIDLLAKFASNVGKRIQQAINEIKPQKAELKQGPGEASSIRERHAFGTRKESDYTGITAVSSYQESDLETFNTSSKVQVAEQVTITRSVDLSVRADKKKTRPADVRVLSEHHEDENDERIKDAKADDVREEGKLKESLGVDVLSLKQLEHEYTEQCDEAGKREIGGELEDTAETILTGEGTDVKHSDQSLTASDKEAEAKSKKKKKSKKKGRGKESENKPLPLEKSDNVSDIKQMDSENEGQSQVTKSITGVSPLPVKVKILESTPERDLHVKDGELKIDGKVDAAEVSLVSQDDQQANDNGGQPDMTRAEIVRKQMEECVDKQYGKTEMGVSVQKGAKRPEKSNLPDNEKAALIMKAKESILKKVFEKGVTEKQAAEELEALRKEVHRKDIQAGNARDGKMQTPVIKMETPSRKMATPLTKMVDVEGSTDEDDHRKMPDAKPKVEWKGETGGRKENLKVDGKEVVVVDEPNLTDDSSLALKEAKTLSKEKDDCVGGVKEGKDKETVSPDQHNETPLRKMVTPLTEMVDVGGSTDEDDLRKPPDAKTKVEWMGKTSGRKEENLKVNVKEVVVVDEPNLTDDSSLALKEAKTLSKEKDDCVGGVKEGKDKETVSPDQHKETLSRKMVTPLTEMVDVEGSTDEDDLRKRPDAKTKVEWMGKTSGRKEENLKVDVKEVVVVDEPNLTDDSSLALKEAKTLSKEKDDCVGGVKEGKDKETVSPDQHNETPLRKMVTPLTEMVDVEGSTDEDDLRKPPDAKTKVEWMGKTGGRKEENLKVNVKEVVVVDEPNLTDDSSLALKEAKTLSKEKDDCVGGVKEGKDKETVSPDQHKETLSRKMVTPLTEMVDVEGSTDEDDFRKRPDAKTKVEWMGKTGGRKEENLKVDVKEVVVVDEPNLTDDSSLALKEAKTLSKEKDDCVGGVKEGKDKETVSPDQHKETLSRKMVTPLTEMVDVEGSTDEDDLRKRPDAKTKVEWMGKTSGRKEENLKVNVKEVVVVDEPNLTDDSSLALKEAKTVSKEKDDCVGDVKEGKDKETVSPDKHKETPSRKMVTPLTEMVNVEGSTDEDDLRKWPDAKPKVEWMGKAGGRKEENLKVDVKEALVVAEPKITDDSSLAIKEAKTLSKEADDRVCGVKEGKQTVSPDQHKETRQGKRQKKNKKSKIAKIAGHADAATEKPWTDDAVQAVVTATICTKKTGINVERKTDDQKGESLKYVKSESDVDRPSSSDDTNKMASSTVDAKTTNEVLQRPIRASAPAIEKAKAEVKSAREEFKGPLKVIESKSVEEIKEALQMTGKQSAGDEFKRSLHSSFIKSGGEEVKEHIQKYVSDTVREEMKEPLKMGGINSTEEKLKEALQMTVVKEMKEPVHIAEIKSAAEEMKGPLGLTGNQSAGEEVKKHVQKAGIGYVGEVIKEPIPLAGMTSIGKELKEHQLNIKEQLHPAIPSIAADVFGTTYEAVDNKSLQPDSRSVDSMKQDPNLFESPLPSQTGNKRHPESLLPSEENPTESELAEVLESDTTTESSGEGEEDKEEIKMKKKKGSAKSSLIRQECLEHDQRIVALVSMVRHIEVCLKQQQQQSVGRGLISLEDIIRQTEALSLELQDLEPEVNKEVEATAQLLEPRPSNVPPQLLLALEKDMRSLARGYESARGVSETILQGLREHRDSFKEAVTAEQKNLGGLVENLLTWLSETEARSIGAMAGKEEDSPVDQITQQLEYCKEFQAALTARSNEVIDAAFDVQVFISERAQDLAPEQSRHLLGQLQRLQGAFHQASGQARARAETLSNQRAREEELQQKESAKVQEEEKEREIERQTARKIEVVKQQKAECSQKLEGLNVWLAGAASMLANQKACVESGDVDVLQEKQKELKEVQKDLQSKAEGVAGTIRSVEDFLSERGDCLSPEERESLQGALRKMKEHYADLTNAADASVTQLDTAISTTLTQNTQRAKAEEDLQETRGQIDAMLEGLSSLSAPAVKAAATKCSTSPEDVIDGRLSSTQPEGALQSHTDMLQAEMQQLQAQQAQLLQVAQSTRSLLEQPDSAVPPEEKRRLRASLDQLQAQHQSKLQSCQDRLRKSEVLRDELSKFLQEHGGLGTWLDQSEKELRSLGEGETDAQGLKGRLEEHKKLAEEVICHKADLRFVSISGQKVLDSVQGALEQAGGSDPALDSTKQLVTDKLHDANHRYTALHTKSSELGGRLSGLLERSQQYQDEAVSLHSWLSSQEQERDTARPSGDTNPQNLQSALRQVQLLQDELAARSVQLEKVKRAGRELVSTEESPSLKAVDILCTADGLERRFDTLSASVSERAEQLQTAVAQSVSVQEGLKGLLSWLDQLVLSPGPVQPTAQAVQDAMTQNQKLRQELLSRQGSVDATRDSLSKLLQSADAATASDLQGALAQLNGRYAAAQASQTEREAELKVLLPRLESYERLGADLQGFTQSRLKALGPVGQPEHSVDDYRQTLEEVKSDLEQEAGQLKSFCELGTDLSQSQAISNSQSLLDNVKEVSDEFSRLEANVNDRFSAIQGCEQRLAQFRGLSGSLLRWLQASQDQLPAKEPSLDTEGMQRRVQQLQDLCDDWESQGARVQELNKTGSELESTIIGITAPQTKTGAPQMNGSANPGSVNGIHTCKDLTELQVAVAEVNGRYESLGSELKERHGRQQAALELRQQASQGAQELSSWLRDREHSLEQGHNASPSKPEVVRAKAQENKALLRELTEHSGKVEELKASLTKLVADNPDSPEAASWRQQLQELDSRWQKANETAAQRQTELETCADRLGSFATAASQLGPWLREKELMMSVLGPLSIDPNMLNTQKQQVQFMLREFDTRRPQYDELTQSAEGILSQSGDAPQDPKDLQEVRAELGSISKQWEDLTSRLDLRSGRIDRAQGTSERYQALLKELAASVGDLGERLDGQASLSAQPEALRSRLQETGEVRSELELRRAELGEAERLCEELSAIVDEPYLREELSKRLEAVGAPLRSLEERAADGLSQLQAALSSTQQFQQMFDELRCWLDNQADTRDSSADSLPCQPEALRSLLAHAEDLQRGIAAQRGSYELLQAEGASLLAALPAGGDERSALQSRLSGLRQDWDGQNQRATDRQNRLKSTLAKAETYQKHRAELVPWLEECEGKDVEIRPSLDPAALDEALQRARTLSMDLDRRRPLVDALNTAADQLLEQCRVGEEEVRDEKAQLNRRVDGLGERVHDHTSQLEELAGRLKEFQEGRQSVERRLDAAKHQIEVQEALGPQACSAKSLERLRSQQEALRSLQPQVVYLRDLAQGLVQDAPQTPGGGREGAERLQQQATDTEKEYEDVTEKVEQCSAALESRLQGVGEVQTHVRDVFSRLADLDDELDSLSPVGRDGDSLASQAEALRGLLARVGDLRHQLDGHGTECTAMLRREGSSPDLLALRRETEALSRQAGKLNERGQVRLGQIEDAAEKVREFYGLVAELQGMLGRAEEGLNAQGLVGTEVEIIKQQLQEFKALEREQVDGIQPRLKHVNAVGQGLIQSAAKHTDTQALEHDLENTNLQWNSLNKRVAERIAQLQEALLHCGKFQDALEPLLSWLSDTEELVANQKPPSAEYRVVKAQIQEQKLLQRLLDDRRPTVQMIQAEGERIAATADAQDRDKIQSQLQSLGERWTELLDKASGRQRKLEELQGLALQFHEALEPLGEWLSATERRLTSAEPMGTQTAKISQQISKHKALHADVSSRGAEVDLVEALGQTLSPLCCPADGHWLRERVGAVHTGHSELLEWCRRRAGMLEQALANAQLFGEEEVEVLNWLEEVGLRLAQVSVQSFQPQPLTEQHKHTLSLNEEIVSRKKTVDQAIKNGQALLKQTTGEEVLLIQEKLDGIKTRYAEMTAGSSKALRTLEQALQLSTRFASAHDDLNQWLDTVEAELNNMEPDATPAYQERQKELKKLSAEKRLVLDTVNEVGSALLDLVPWRAREGLDRLVADANQRYRQADETITQRVQLVQAAIQRSQQLEEAVDAELAWARETERKLSSLGPLSLEPDVTVAQLQVQRAFNIDIIRHKDTVDQLLATHSDILDTCTDAQRDALATKTDALSERYEAVSQKHSERFSALEQAQVLVARFWETYEELEPWLGETETLIAQLPPAAIDTDALRLQQDQMRLLRESIAEHKPHIDKLLKIGPQMALLSAQEGPSVTQRYVDSERRYLAIKEEVKGRAGALDEAVSQSVQFHDKMDPLLETLEGAVQRLRQPPPVAAEVDKIREQLGDHRAQGLELDKLLPSFSALCSRGEELIGRAAHDDPAAQAVRSRLLRLRSLWEEIRQRAEEREAKLSDVLDLAEKFWADMAALLSTLRDSQDIVRELEDPGVDPSLIKQQIEAAEAIKGETDGLREELEFVRTLGADLIFACGETEKPEVKKTIDEMNGAWEGLNRTWRERMERLEEAMTASVQYQDALQGMFDYLDNAVIKLCDMPTVGTDLGTVKQQIEELKQYKVEVYQQQIDMEKLCHQGELLLKKVSDQTDRDMIQEPLTELRHLWENLGDKITHRQHKLEGALLALGQFQHALSELQAWLNHTHATLDTQRPVNSDPKAIEIELAKHHVLRNDVLSHHSTVEAVNGAGAELLESTPGDEVSHLRDQLDTLNSGWESLLLKTQERQKLLEAALHQAEGFHGDLEEFLQWLRRTETQLSAAKPTGGLPETAREQLQQHMELQTTLSQRAEHYHGLLDQGEAMLLARGGEEGGPGTTQTQQNLAMLQNKWASLSTKIDDRRGKLEEALSLATGFQSSLQDTINWLTQAEQTLNMAQAPSLILDTVLFQIDEHKVFVNEVNTHREQVLALEKAGSQLRFASLKQDVVLIKNLLLSVQARWDKLVQRSLDRGRHLDEARKRAKQFHEAWRKLTDWLEEAESRLDSELEISNEPDKIKLQLSKHKEFQKALGSKQPVYDTTVRSGKAMRDKTQLPSDTQKLDHLLGELRDKWDTVCGKSVERQHKLEEALLFSGQFAEALQALVDWLYRVEPQLAEDQPVHGDLDLVSNLMDTHKAFQKELGKRTSSIQALKRSARELMDTGRDDTAWVKVQLQELSNRWDTVCALSVSKQTRLQQAVKQAEEFRTNVQILLEWLSEAEQTLRFRGVLPEEADTLQTLLHTHRDFMGTVEEKRSTVNSAAGMGEAILTQCHPDSVTTIKHWITIIRARFEEVLTWAKQHEQRLETALNELLNNANLLEELLSWLQYAETALIQRDTEPLPQDITQLKSLITEHQVFMEEMTRKQPDVDKVTKTYKRKPAEVSSSLAERRGARKNQQQQPQQHQHAAMLIASSNPRLNQLCARWQQVWLLALDRQRKLNDALDRLEELKEFANFDFDVWRKKYMRWMNHKKSRVMDFFRRIDKDQDGKITRQEFIDGILASKFPTSRLEMTAVADIFDRDGDGYIDYYEFVAALHPNKDAYRPTTDADKIEDEVTRQVAQCKCAKRFQVEQIGENKYRFFLGNQFGDSQQLRLVRILRSTVMVRVGGGWMALDEFLVKNDPCRARGRTNLELREKFIIHEGVSQGLAAFRSRGRRSKPGSRTASPTRSSSSASHSAHSCASLPSTPATPTASSSSSRSSNTHSRDYAKPWLAHSKTPTTSKSNCCPDQAALGPEGTAAGSKLKRPTFHSSRGSLTGENGGSTPTSAKPGRPGEKPESVLLRSFLIVLLLGCRMSCKPNHVVSLATWFVQQQSFHSKVHFKFKTFVLVFIIFYANCIAYLIASTEC